MVWCLKNYLKECLSIRCENQGCDSDHIFFLDAGGLDDLTTQVRQGVNGQVALVCQAGETVLGISTVGLKENHQKLKRR